MAIFKKGNGEWGMGSVNWGTGMMRLIIYHEILHSEQFEVAEFIDDNNFLWFLTPVFFLVRSSGRRTAINFDETLYSAQIESAAFNGDNKIL